MSHRSLLVVALAAVAVASLAPARVATQTLASPKIWTHPKTAWGHPDLQGTWRNFNDTPLQRQADDKQLNGVPGAGGRGGRRPGGTPYFEPGHEAARPSMIVDPPDGRLPALLPEAVKRQADYRAARNERAVAHPWENHDPWERCIARGLPHAMVPVPYNNNYKILQTPKYVVILYELMQEVRKIPLDGRPHVGQNIPQWMGDSRGHWEGNTLVVDVTNFSDKTDGTLKDVGISMAAGFPPEPNFRGSGSGLHLVERFTRVDADTIDYSFTYDDPKTYTKPFTVLIPMKKQNDLEDPLFEYTCHEGNYSMATESKAIAAERAQAATKR